MSAAAQPQYYDPLRRPNLIEMAPRILGNGDTIVTAKDCRIRRYRITNPAGSGANVTVSIRDGQGTPVYILGPSILPPGAEAVETLDLDGDLCLGGIIVNTTQAGVLHGYLKAALIP